MTDIDATCAAGEGGVTKSVNMDDYYAFTTNPIDVNLDMVIDAQDQRDFRSGLRDGEIGDVTIGR